MLDQGQSSVSGEESSTACLTETVAHVARDGKGRFRQAMSVGGNVGSALVTARELLSNPTVLALALLCQLQIAAGGWGGGNDDGIPAFYSAAERRSEWMESASKLNIDVIGCAWGNVEGGEDAADDFACRENESEDGTYYWYQMANCRRAQVVYNIYDGGSCSATTFKESYMTKTGLAEFIDTMNTYDANSPLGNVDAGNYPMCEEDGYGYYLSVGCDSKGQFAVNKFTDEYCLEYYGEDSDYDLSSINYAMQDMQGCYDAYDSSNGESVYNSGVSYLLAYSEPCTSLDSDLCTDSQELGGSSSGYPFKHKHHSASGAAIANKLKYVLGALLLVASVTMFMGILFTNRRRRRAMMHRRFRQSASRSRSSRSRRSRGHSSSRSKSRARSSSRKRREGGEGGVSGGVFT